MLVKFAKTLNVTVTLNTTKTYGKKELIEALGSDAESYRPFKKLRLISVDQDSAIYINREDDLHKYTLLSGLSPFVITEDLPIHSFTLVANATTDTVFCLEIVSWKTVVPEVNKPK